MKIVSDINQFDKARGEDEVLVELITVMMIVHIRQDYDQSGFV